MMVKQAYVKKRFNDIVPVLVDMDPFGSLIKQHICRPDESQGMYYLIMEEYMTKSTSPYYFTR